jgi:hypothetical protein
MKMRKEKQYMDSKVRRAMERERTKKPMGMSLSMSMSMNKMTSKRKTTLAANWWNMKKNKVIMLITTARGAMKLARRSKRTRRARSMTAVIVIRSRGEGDVEKAADDETASYA